MSLRILIGFVIDLSCKSEIVPSERKGSYTSCIKSYLHLSFETSLLGMKDLGSVFNVVKAFGKASLPFGLFVELYTLK